MCLLLLTVWSIKSKRKDFQFTLTEEKHKTFTFERLEPIHFCHFCRKYLKQLVHHDKNHLSPSKLNRQTHPGRDDTGHPDIHREVVRVS